MSDLSRLDTFRIARSLIKSLLADKMLANAKSESSDPISSKEFLKTPVEIDYVDAYSFRGSFTIPEVLQKSFVNMNPKLFTGVDLNNATVNFIYENDTPDNNVTRDYLSLVSRETSSQMIIINTEDGQTFIIYKPNVNETYYAVSQDIFPNRPNQETIYTPLKGGVVQLKHGQDYEYGFFDNQNIFTNTNANLLRNPSHNFKFNHGGEADSKIVNISTIPCVTSDLHLCVIQFDEKGEKKIKYFNKGISEYKSDIDLDINSGKLPIVVATASGFGHFTKAKADTTFWKSGLNFVVHEKNSTNYLTLQVEKKQILKLVNEHGYRLLANSDITVISEYFVKLSQNVTPLTVLFLQKNDFSLSVPWIYIGKKQDGSIFLHVNNETNSYIQNETLNQKPFNISAPQFIKENG